MKLLNTKEVADNLKTTRQTVYKLIQCGQLNGFKSDTGKYLVFQESLDRYIDSCYNKYKHSNVIS